MSFPKNSVTEKPFHYKQIVIFDDTCLIAPPLDNIVVVACLYISYTTFICWLSLILFTACTDSPLSHILQYMMCGTAAEVLYIRHWWAHPSLQHGKRKEGSSLSLLAVPRHLWSTTGVCHCLRGPPEHKDRKLTLFSTNTEVMLLHQICLPYIYINSYIFTIHTVSEIKNQYKLFPLSRLFIQ